MESQSHFIAVSGGAALHLRHFPGPGTPAFLLHGAIENGRVFYSNSGRGLAPFLASHGLDVYVLDLRGRGRSTPSISRGATHGQAQSISEELPAAADFIAARRPGVAQLWISHSWGGVLQLAALARQPERLAQIAAMVQFGVKRSITVYSASRLLRVELGWKILSPLIAACVGYLPARRLGFGGDSETIASLRASNAWIRPGAWLDPDDGFDYAKALQSLQLPPLLALTGAADAVLGHPKDVRLLLREIRMNEDSLIIVGKRNGYAHDYDHINLLTHHDAPSDHFNTVVAWLREQHTQFE